MAAGQRVAFLIAQDRPAAGRHGRKDGRRSRQQQGRNSSARQHDAKRAFKHQEREETQMSRSKCIVCNDIRDIPPEAVPLVSFGGRQPGRSGSWEYEMLHRLCKADEIRHWKFTRGKTGQLFVMPEEARRALDDAREKQHRLSSKTETARPSDLVYESTCESLADIAQSLSDALPILERLAQAAEAMATHPKQERYEILPMSNGNGFHS